MPDHKRLIEDACTKQGLTVQSWSQDPDYDEPRDQAELGLFAVIEDNDEAGIYEGDEGTLIACVVGAAEFGNERVAFVFTADGCDSGSEVSPYDVEAI